MLFLLLLAAALAWGQEPVPAEMAARVSNLFQARTGERELPCEVKPLPPALSYRMLYSSGYVVDTPAAGSTELAVLVRFTPEAEGARPLLLRSVHKLPKEAAANPKAELEISGRYFLGPGEYRAELVLLDEAARVCRKQWKVVLKPPKVGATELRPGQLAAISEIHWPKLVGPPGRLVVLIHAGPAALNQMLVDSLAALVERIPRADIDVVVFNLEQHKVLLREHLTDAAGFERVQKSLEDFQSQTVSYGALKDPAGHRDLLWKLLAQETRRATPADLVFFLGVSTLDDSHVFTPPGCGQGKPLYAYFDFAEPKNPRPPRRFSARRLPMGLPQRDRDTPPDGTLPGIDRPDAITRAMKACSGLVFHIHSPDGLALALEKAAGLRSQEKP